MGQKRNLKGDEKLKALCIKMCRMMLKHVYKFIELNDFFSNKEVLNHLLSFHLTR